MDDKNGDDDTGEMRRSSNNDESRRGRLGVKTRFLSV